MAESGSKLDGVHAGSDPNELWPLFKERHNKAYGDDEDKVRFDLFKETIATIVEHNAKYEKGEVTFTMGLNHFADLKPEEKKFGSFGKR